jgi:hypothetical protein
VLRRAGILPPDTILFHLKLKTFMLIAGEASGKPVQNPLFSLISGPPGDWQCSPGK